MKPSLRAAAAALCAGGAISAAPAAFAIENVADNGSPSITLNGIFGVLGPAATVAWTPPNAPTPVFAPPHTLVDNVFSGMFGLWTQNTVFWDASVPGAGSNSIVINLDQPYAISQLLLEGDQGEIYRVEYRSGASWLTAWDANPIPLFGMQTRVSPVLAPFVTDALRITAIGGDGLAAVSEVQAFGVAAVPEPGAWAMLAAGLGMLGLFVRRRLR